MKSKNLLVGSFNTESAIILKVSAFLKVWMEKEHYANARDVSVLNNTSTLDIVYVCMLFAV